MAANTRTIGTVAHRQILLSNVYGLSALLLDPRVNDDVVTDALKKNVPFVRASKDGSAQRCDVHYREEQRLIWPLPAGERFPHASCETCKSGGKHGISLWDYDSLGARASDQSVVLPVSGWSDVVSKLRELQSTAISRGLEEDSACDVDAVTEGGKQQIRDRLLCVKLDTDQTVHEPFDFEWTVEGGHRHLTIFSPQPAQLVVKKASGKGMLNCLLLPNIGLDSAYVWTPCCFVLRARADPTWRNHPGEFDKTVTAALELLYHHAYRQPEIGEMERFELALGEVLAKCKTKDDLAKLDEPSLTCLQEAAESASSAAIDDNLEPEIAEQLSELQSTILVLSCSVPAPRT